MLELAASGERDPVRLRNFALTEVGASAVWWKSTPMRPSLFLNKNRRRKPEAKRRAPGYRAAATAEYERAFERLFGSQGAASPVRRIDPVTGEVIGIIDTTDKGGSRPA
jgi:hypothetical protein